jgi:hypothetical protein
MITHNAFFRGSSVVGQNCEKAHFPCPPHNIGEFCLRMRENRSVRLQMADFKGL